MAGDLQVGDLQKKPFEIQMTQMKQEEKRKEFSGDSGSGPAAPVMAESAHATAMKHAEEIPVLMAEKTAEPVNIGEGGEGGMLQREAMNDSLGEYREGMVHQKMNLQNKIRSFENGREG